MCIVQFNCIVVIQMYDIKTQIPLLERTYMLKDEEPVRICLSDHGVLIQYIRVAGLSWDKRLSELPADPSRLLQ